MKSIVGCATVQRGVDTEAPATRRLVLKALQCHCRCVCALSHKLVAWQRAALRFGPIRPAQVPGSDCSVDPDACAVVRLRGDSVGRADPAEAAARGLHWLQQRHGMRCVAVRTDAPADVAGVQRRRGRVFGLSI